MVNATPSGGRNMHVAWAGHVVARASTTTSGRPLLVGPLHGVTASEGERASSSPKLICCHIRSLGWASIRRYASSPRRRWGYRVSDMKVAADMVRGCRDDWNGGQ